MNKSKIISALMLSTILLGQAAPGLSLTQEINEAPETEILAEVPEVEAPEIELPETVEESTPEAEAIIEEVPVSETIQPEPEAMLPTDKETGVFHGVSYTFEPENGVLTFQGGTLSNDFLPFIEHIFGFDSGSVQYARTNIKKIIFTAPITAGWALNGFFIRLTALTEIKGLENLKTASTESMNAMFAETSVLTHLDISGLDTSSLWEGGLSGMFFNSGVESLDMTGITLRRHLSDFMFYGAYHLNKLILGPNTDITWGRLRTLPDNQAWVHEDGRMLSSADLMSLSANSDQATGTWQVREVWNGVAYSFEQGVLTLHGGAFATTADFWELQNDLRENITKIIFKNPVQANQDSSELFVSLVALMEIEGLKRLDTSGVQDMTAMFTATPVLNRLDLSGFDTMNVLNMEMMFAVSGIEHIEFGEHFDTSQVRNMTGMFAGTSNLTHLDLSGFDTRNVSIKQHMFAGTNNLQTLILGQHTDISHTNLPNATNQTWRHTDGTIRDSAGLTALSSQAGAAAGTWNLVPAWNGVAYSYNESSGLLTLHGGALVNGASRLREIPVAGPIRKIKFAGPVTAHSNMQDFFNGMRDVTEIENIHFLDVSRTTRMVAMFAEMDNLERLDLSSWKITGLPERDWMFSNSGVRSLNLSSFPGGDVWGMLIGTERLTELVLGEDTNIDALPDTILGFTDQWLSTDGHKRTSAELRAGDAAGTWQRVSSLEAATRNFTIASEADNHDLEGWLIEMLQLKDTMGHHHEALDYKDLVAQIHEQLGSTEAKLPAGRHELSLVHHQDPHTQIPVNFTLFVTNDDTALALGDYFIQFEHIAEFDASARENLAGEGLLKAANFTKYEIETDKASSDLDNIVFDQEQKEALVNGDKYGEHLVRFTVAASARAGRADAGGTVRVNLVEERPTTPGPTPTPAPEPESEEEGSVDKEVTDDVQVQEPSETPDSLPQTGEIAASSALLLGLGALLTALGLKKKFKK